MASTAMLSLAIDEFQGALELIAVVGNGLEGLDEGENGSDGDDDEEEWKYDFLRSLVISISTTVIE